jgi:hypothetical protein
MWTKLEALDTVHIVRPPLEKLYDSLIDEQKARFHAVGAEVGQQATTAYADTRGQTTAVLAGARGRPAVGPWGATS